MARDTWYRLDNIGTYYAAQAGRRLQTVFRYAAAMDEEVDPEVLQQALDRAVDRFPTFAVSLRTGLFWHYLVEAPAPRVRPEDQPICAPLHAGRSSVLCRVSWYGDRINFEVSHIVSDGRGSLAFFKELLRTYVALRYDVEVPESYTGSLTQSSEDSFDKNYEPSQSGTASLSRAAHVPSPRRPDDPAYFEYHLSAAAVLSVARSWGVSLTSVVIAAAALAVRAQLRLRDLDRPIRIGVPVDLRDAFSSQTTRNFFGLTYVTFGPDSKDLGARELAREAQRQIGEAVRPENIKRRMNAMIKLEKNPLVRIAPVLLKDLGLVLANSQEGRAVSTTVSNLGRIVLDPAVADHVRNIDILTSSRDLNFTLCSVGDDLSIGIATVYTELGVVRDFCRFFSGLGIAGEVNYSRARPLDATGAAGTHLPAPDPADYWGQSASGATVPVAGEEDVEP